MEEIAAHVSISKPSGGIRFARNRDGDEKQAARQLILSLFCPEKWPRRLHILSMPGLGWKLERQLLTVRDKGWESRRASGRTYFTSCESDRPIYLASCTQMPGIEQMRRSPVRMLSRKFPFCEYGIKTEFASFFFADVDDLMKFAIAQWRPFDAAWLDFTGPMTPERLALLSEFFVACVSSTLIVTMLAARDSKASTRSFQKEGGRGEWLRRSLPGTVLHDIEYFDTSPMRQIAIQRTDAPLCMSAA